MVMLEAADAEPVTITWQELHDGVSAELLHQVHLVGVLPITTTLCTSLLQPTQAYGPDGLGVLVIAGIPDLREIRKSLLPLVHQLAVGSWRLLELFRVCV